MDFFHHDILFAACRILLVGVWGYGLFRIWRYRHLPHANQVLAAALAMVLSDSLLLLGAAPQDVLIFFNAMSQVVLVTAFAQVFRALHKKSNLRITESTQEHLITLLGIGGAGLFGVFTQYLWMH